MLINKIVFDSVVVVVGTLLNGVADNYGEVSAMVNDWERYKGFCPSDIVDQLKTKVKSIDTVAVDMGFKVFEKTDLYVVDIDFKGWVNTQIILIDGVQYSQYGDKLISGYDLTKQKIVNSEELDQLLENHHKSLVSKPEPISEEYYNDMLEVLPPCRWHHSSGFTFFHVSERLTGDLVSWFCQYDDKFYSFTNQASLTTQKLVNIMKEAV